MLPDIIPKSQPKCCITNIDCQQQPNNVRAQSLTPLDHRHWVRHQNHLPSTHHNWLCCTSSSNLDVDCPATHHLDGAPQLLELWLSVQHASTLWDPTKETTHKTHVNDQLTLDRPMRVSRQHNLWWKEATTNAITTASVWCTTSYNILTLSGICIGGEIIDVVLNIQTQPCNMVRVPQHILPGEIKVCVIHNALCRCYHVCSVCCTLRPVWQHKSLALNVSHTTAPIIIYEQFDKLIDMLCAVHVVWTRDNHGDATRQNSTIMIVTYHIQLNNESAYSNVDSIVLLNSLGGLTH